MSFFTAVPRIILIMLLIGIMAGCISSEGIVPQSKLPALQQIDTGSTIQSAQNEATWPKVTWWAVYGDEQLNHLMQQALSDNPGLAEVQARIRAATAISDKMNAINLPQISGTAAVSRKRWPTDYFYGPGALGGTTSWDNTSLLHLDYDPDLWGKNTKLAAQALDHVHWQVAEARMVQLDIQANLISAYIMLSYQTAQLRLTQQITKQYQAILAITKTRWQAGLATQIELNAAQTELADSKIQLANWSDAVQISQHELAALTGHGPAIGEQLHAPELHLTQTIGLPKVLPANLIGQRPDVIASRWLVAAQNKGIQVSKASFYPNINLTAALGFMAVNGGALSLFTSPKLTYGVGPALSLPIFDAGQLRAQLREADANYDIAVEMYKSSIINALKEISNSVVKLRTAEEQQQNALNAVTAAQQAYHVAETAYKRGLINYMAVAQAHIKLYQQQQLQQCSIALKLGAYGRVVIVLGGGLMTSTDSPNTQQMRYQDKDPTS